MSIKANIINDFLHAFKNKKFFRKDTLNLIKAKITEKEKSNSSDQPLSDSEVISILQSMIKQRTQTIDSYKDIKQTDKIEIAISNEKDQIAIISEYLPNQMLPEELTAILQKIYVDGTFLNETNNGKKIGMIMKFFKEKYEGKYDAATLKGLIKI